MKTLGYYLDIFFKAEIEDQQDLAWSKQEKLLKSIGMGTKMQVEKLK